MIPGNSLCYEEMLKESRLIERRNLFSSQMAKEEGVLISINSDAHSVYDFANLRFGIGQARLAGETRCIEYPLLEGIASPNQSHHVIIM
ncbi:hypothetical protein [Nitrosomonas sp.]|uniref:hypothetical protein n=1 Tax=Nitrosomonas sp. TaxID=42353 RepID=UPI0025F23D81|nr:hypothetical protein [Nitrosomonas sp.]